MSCKQKLLIKRLVWTGPNNSRFVRAGWNKEIWKGMKSTLALVQKRVLLNTVLQIDLAWSFQCDRAQGFAQPSFTFFVQRLSPLSLPHEYIKHNFWSVLKRHPVDFDTSHAPSVFCDLYSDCFKYWFLLFSYIIFYDGLRVSRNCYVGNWALTLFIFIFSKLFWATENCTIRPASWSVII